MSLESLTPASRKKKRQYISFPHMKETVFEKHRGVNKVEIKKGFAQVELSELPKPITQSRLDILAKLHDKKVNVDFLKLTNCGLAFTVQESDLSLIEKILGNNYECCNIQPDRNIMLIHAVNMRDEEGLIADIIAIASSQKITIDQVSDMHDRLLLVTSEDSAKKLKTQIEKELMD